ncbi:MAG: hypothetical protein PF484_11730 [Bacteroidales bacterium]|nr:hypothetical protein [Bacteroidales bacterium]
MSQLLGVLGRQTVHVLFDKYNFDSYQTSSTIGISEEIKSGSEEQLSELIGEIIRTSNTLRNGVSPKYKYNDQVNEFKKSLLLDGYEIADKTIKSLDPNFEGKEPVEDELVNELRRSGLDQNDEIVPCLRASASDFIKAQPDYNGSLTNIRICLETIVRKIALKKDFVNAREGNTWGPSLGFLKTKGFFTEKEEKTLASIFTFVSDGAHVPIGFSKEEFVRLGRNICASMCYFVIKKYNA